MSWIDSVNHVGIVVRDLDSAVAQYEAMGFALTPYSQHSGAWKPGAEVKRFDSGNRCVMFARNYLEVLASGDPAEPDARLAGFLKGHQGAHIICFNSDRPDRVDAEVRQAGLQTSGVIPLQRDIDTPDGIRTAKFERVQLAVGETPEGYIQAAHHLTPEFIYQPRYTTHPNGCFELSEVFLVVDDVSGYAARYGKILGLAPEADGPVVRFHLPSFSALTVVDYRRAGDVLPGSLMPKVPCIAGVAFRTPQFDAMRSRLEAGGFHIVDTGDRLVVPAEEAAGVAIVFAQ